MPVNQETLAHHWEMVGEEWVRPADALAAHAEGAWQMISPTLVTLRSIASFGDVAAMLAAVSCHAHLEPLTDTLRQQGMADLR